MLEDGLAVGGVVGFSDLELVLATLGCTVGLVMSGRTTTILFVMGMLISCETVGSILSSDTIGTLDGTNDGLSDSCRLLILFSIFTGAEVG